MQKVMVVDNNPVVLKFMESFLVKNGYSVKLAENGLIALDLLKNYSPDIIFVDLIMPYIKGEMLVSILREREDLPKIRIIILSGVAAEIELDYIAMGADACIAKGPFNSMGKHIIHTLNELDNKNGNNVVKQVIGLEDVFKRSITKELMLRNLQTKVVLESISDCLIEISIDFRIVYMNKSALAFFQRKQQKIIGANILKLMELNWVETVVEYLETVKAGTSVQSVELIRNNECYILTAKKLNSSKDHTIVLLLRDISLEKQREADLKNKINDREMMIKEVYHRVKNNLAMVSSIINLQIGESTNDIELHSLNDLRSRIDSISMVHAKLFRGKDLNNIGFDDYIEDLVDNLINSLASTETVISTDIVIPEVAIDFDKAVPLGIIFTELTTNALKYAFIGKNTGLISITYNEIEDGVELVFADNGSGLYADFSVDKAESLGFNLILSLVMQLHGSISVENKKGAEFTIILPRF